jgi:OOP family OmpA-OmpF porin
MKYLLLSALFISGLSVAGTAKIMDGDKDGIADTMDKCMSTPPGRAVNELGCLKGETVTMKLNILYPTGQEKFTDEATAHLNKLASYLKSYPDARLTIEGHSDDTGSDQRNMVVSEKRAEEVKNYLVTKEGVSESQIIVTGFGEQQPLDTNTTKEGRAQNRRVVGVVMQ